jgi:hypothetical protein
MNAQTFDDTPIHPTYLARHATIPFKDIYLTVDQARSPPPNSGQAVTS